MPKPSKKKVVQRRSRKRVPITITLTPSTYAFMESCASLKAFRSVDELFEAALNIYQQHTRALLTYTQTQSDKGLTRDEILRSIKCEILLTKVARRTRAPARRA